MKRTKWLGHEIDENGIKPNEEKEEAILKLKSPNNTKELKSFLGAIQYLVKFLPKLSEKTDRLRKEKQTRYRKKKLKFRILGRAASGAHRPKMKH